MNTQTKIAKKTGYHHGDLRAQLVEATRRLVEEKGPDHFSVAEACREAGVSTAAPYKHFKDKDEMIRAVIWEGMLRHRDQMLAAIAPIPEGSPDRVIALGKVYVSFARTEPGVFRLMFALSERHGDDEELVECGRTLFGIVIQAVAHCLGREEPVEDDVQRAFMLWSFVHGLSFLTIDGKVNKVELDVSHDGMIADITRRVLPECFST
jgi:AcrR family transcriptional regulator